MMIKGEFIVDCDPFSSMFVLESDGIRSSNLRISLCDSSSWEISPCLCKQIEIQETKREHAKIGCCRWGLQAEYSTHTTTQHVDFRSSKLEFTKATA